MEGSAEARDALIVTFSITVGQEPHGLGDMSGVITIEGHPRFGLHNLNKRFTLIPDANPNARFDIVISGPNGEIGPGPLGFYFAEE